MLFQKCIHNKLFNLTIIVFKNPAAQLGRLFVESVVDSANYWKDLKAYCYYYVVLESIGVQ